MPLLSPLSFCCADFFLYAHEQLSVIGRGTPPSEQLYAPGATTNPTMNVSLLSIGGSSDGHLGGDLERLYEEGEKKLHGPLERHYRYGAPPSTRSLSPGSNLPINFSINALLAPYSLKKPAAWRHSSTDVYPLVEHGKPRRRETPVVSQARLAHTALFHSAAVSQHCILRLISTISWQQQQHAELHSPADLHHEKHGRIPVSRLPLCYPTATH